MCPACAVAHVFKLAVARIGMGGDFTRRRGDAEEFLTEGNEANEEGELSADSNRVGLGVRAGVLNQSRTNLLERPLGVEMMWSSFWPLRRRWRYRG
jgi:hypothetical protein